MRSGAHLAHQSARYQLGESGPCSTRGQSDGLGNLAGAVLLPAFQQSEDRLIGGIDNVCRHGAAEHDGFSRRAGGRVDGDAQPQPNLLPYGGSETGFAARCDHALDTAAPLLDQSEFMKYPADGPVAELGDALGQIVERQPEREQAGILYLDPIVENCEPDRRSPLRVVRMRNRVDDCFADGHDRHAPPFVPSDLADRDAAQCMFLHEDHRIFNRLRQWSLDVQVVGDGRLVDAGEAPGLDPGVGKVSKAIDPEKKDPADRRYQPSLVRSKKPKCLQIAPRQSPRRCERLGSSSEVDGFRVERR